MRNRYSKYIAGVLMLSVTSCALFSGCSKSFQNSKPATIITEDNEPWYVSETRQLEDAFDNVSYTTSSGFYNGKFYVVSGLNTSNGVGSDIGLAVYSLDGELLDSLVFSSFEEFDLGDSYSQFFELNSACYESGYFVLGVEDYNEYLKSDYLFSLDDFSISLLNTQDVMYGSISESYNVISPDEYEHAYYDIESNTVNIDYVKDEEVLSTINLNSLLTDEYCISSFPYLFFEANKLLFTVAEQQHANDYDQVQDMVVYDLNDRQIYDYYGGTVYPEREFVLESNEGEYKYELDGFYTRSSDGSWNCAIPFDRCDLVSSTMLDSYVADYSDEGLSYFYFDYELNSFHVCFTKVTKVDSNPHVGKELIKAAFVDTTSQYIEQSVYDFNATSDSYYISIEHKYDDLAYNVSYSFDINDSVMSAEAELQKEIAADNKLGQGPDLYFGLSNFSLLQSETYLEDITYMAEKDFSSKSYLTNIIDASRSTDGKIYSLPLAFYVNGLAVEKNLVDSQGFVYEDYLDVVEDEFDGTDPLNYQYSKLNYFLTLFENQPQLFFDKNGKIDAKGSSFIKMAQYCNDNVPDSFDRSLQYVYGETEVYDVDAYNKYSNMSCNINGAITYLEAVNYGGSSLNKICGIPSENGIGPVATITESVSLSADSGSKEGCWEFVKYLMGTESQSKLQYEIPVNIEAIDTAARNEIENFNLQSDMSEINYYYINITDNGVYNIPYETIDDYIDMVSGIKNVSYYDPEIVYIVEQEMNSYFGGQITLEQATEAIQDRCNKVVDDRR